MSLAAGTRLGPYEILAPIAGSGTEELYRGTDARLNREVAIKVFAAPFSDRFEREARAVAALNHPNICALHDIGHQDGVDFLVMEYLEGQTLAKLLEGGALDLNEAMALA